MNRKSMMGTVCRVQRGFTLVEMLVALALGLAVLIGLSSVYVAAKQSFRFQETSGRLQEDATFALDLIARDLRMAGFGGCRGVDEVTIASVLTTFPNFGLAASPTGITGPNPLAAVYPTNLQITSQPLSPYNFVRGFDSVPSAMFAVGATPVSSNTDALYFVGGSSKAVSVSAVMAATNSPLAIASDTFSWGTTAANSGVYNMVVSDCKSSSLFAGKVAGGGTSIDHTATLGNAADTFPGSYQYGIDALVMPVEWNLYYAATRSGATTPSLYRVSYDGNSRDGNPQEIITNVEAFKLSYGENTAGKDSATGLTCALSGGAATCIPTLQADVWRASAATVTNWSRVVAVRVGLMMVSSDDRANTDVVAVTPTLLGQTYSIPSGASTTRLRKEFSTTVVLRNRIAPR